MSLAGVGWALPVAGHVPSAPAPGQRTQLAASPGGKPSLRGRQGTYTATVFVAATARRAWDVLTNYEAMAGVMPDIKEARVLSRRGRLVELMQVYQAPYTFGRRINATLAMRENAPRALSYQLLQADDINVLKGSWTITPVRGGVMLGHQIQVDPLIPAFVRPLYYELTETNLLQSMRILKHLIEQ